MNRKEKDSADKSSPQPSRVMVYPDGSVSVDPEAVLRQYREQFKASARSNLEEEKWEDLLNK